MSDYFRLFNVSRLIAVFVILTLRYVKIWKNFEIYNSYSSEYRFLSDFKSNISFWRDCWDMPY